MNLETIKPAIYYLMKIKQLCAYSLRKILYLYYDVTTSSIHIVDSFATLEYIIENKCSVSRYGDGELGMCLSTIDIGFQKWDTSLRDNLCRVLFSENNSINHICCIPYTYKSCAHLKSQPADFWRRIVIHNKRLLSKTLPKKLYFDSLCTRPYMDLVNKQKSKCLFDLWRRVWDDKKLVIIEGEYSRLGDGNDLFSNAESIKRIIAPSENAFSIYEKILQTAKRLCTKDDLILIALGPTATVLAYDLACEGFWAVDIGHIDIEYMWYLSGAENKQTVSGRKINEIVDNNHNCECSPEYYDSIIEKL